MTLKQFVFQFLFRDARVVLRYHLCSTFSLEKKLTVTLFYYFVDPLIWKELCWCTERVHFVSLGNFAWKAANSNILLQNQKCFHKQVSRVQIFTTSKNFYFDQQKLLLWPFAFSKKKETETWIAIINKTRFWDDITALQWRHWEIRNILFSQLAVIIRS